MNENKQNTGIKLIVAALVIALTISFVQIGLLNERIDQLQNGMHNQHQQFMNQIESIYTNVDRQLKEEASLLSGVDAEYGEINLEDHTIDVTVKLVPKLISEDMKISVPSMGATRILLRQAVLSLALFR